jgi:hypothetical protein
MGYLAGWFFVNGNRVGIGLWVFDLWWRDVGEGNLWGICWGFEAWGELVVILGALGLGNGGFLDCCFSSQSLNKLPYRLVGKMAYLSSF